MSDLGGVWRTVGGRRIFIKDGEDLETAMKNSGKFGDGTNKDYSKMNIQQLQQKLDKDVEEYFSKNNIKEAEGIKTMGFGDGLKDMDEEWKKQQLSYIAELNDDYNSNIMSINYKKDDTTHGSSFIENDYDMGMLTYQNNLKDKETYTKTMQSNIKTGHLTKVDDNNIEKATTYHEYAHSLTYSYNKNNKKMIKELEVVYNKYKNDLNLAKKDMDEATTKALFSNDTKDYKIAEEYSKKYNEVFISNYAYGNIDEFSAECFTNAKLNSKPNKYAVEVLQIIDKYKKKK